jgi:hypothetical protein
MRGDLAAWIDVHVTHGSAHLCLRPGRLLRQTVRQIVPFSSSAAQDPVELDTKAASFCTGKRVNRPPDDVLSRRAVLSLSTVRLWWRFRFPLACRSLQLHRPLRLLLFPSPPEHECRASLLPQLLPRSRGFHFH